MVKFHRELRANLEMIGLREITVTRIGKHARVTGEFAGTTLHHIAPVTPSDRRSMLNILGDVKRRIRAMQG